MANIQLISKIRLALLLGIVSVGHDLCHAQLFGRPREIGKPLTRQQTADNLEEVGQITGTERFLRQNRGREAFVGADQNESQGFVGSQQAQTSGTILSSTAGISPPPDRSNQINRPLRRARRGEMYLPRIVLGFDRGEDLRGLDPIADVNARAQQAVRLASRMPIEVLVQGRTAKLRGWVVSESEKNLAETLILFEPGISEVVNQIEVLETLPPPPPQPQPPVDPSSSS